MLFNPTNSGAILVSRSSGTVVMQDCGGAISGLFRGCVYNYYRAALLYMISVKFLFADIVWLFAGKITHFTFFAVQSSCDLVHGASWKVHPACLQFAHLRRYR